SATEPPVSGTSFVSSVFTSPGGGGGGDDVSAERTGSPRLGFVVGVTISDFSDSVAVDRLSGGAAADPLGAPIGELDPVCGGVIAVRLEFELAFKFAFVCVGVAGFFSPGSGAVARLLFAVLAVAGFLSLSFATLSSSFCDCVPLSSPF